jgi:hypothetical protein
MHKFIACIIAFTGGDLSALFVHDEDDDCEYCPPYFLFIYSLQVLGKTTATLLILSPYNLDTCTLVHEEKYALNNISNRGL